jgi:hypothetical protein
MWDIRHSSFLKRSALAREQRVSLAGAYARTNKEPHRGPSSRGFELSSSFYFSFLQTKIQAIAVVVRRVITHNAWRLRPEFSPPATR